MVFVDMFYLHLSIFNQVMKELLMDGTWESMVVIFETET